MALAAVPAAAGAAGVGGAVVTDRAAWVSKIVGHEDVPPDQLYEAKLQRDKTAFGLLVTGLTEGDQVA
jgi:hypothetical protein